MGLAPLSESQENFLLLSGLHRVRTQQEDGLEEGSQQNPTMQAP